MGNLIQDLRFAVRQLGRSPALAAALIATVALGVGAATTIFTVVDGVLLRPLPFAHSERAVVFCETHPSVSDFCIASPPNVADWGRMSASLAEVGVARTWSYTLRDRDGRTPLSAGIATPGYLRVHGARVELGRLLQEPDLVAGSNRVVVLTHALWRSRFGADPGVVGRRLVMDEEPYTVIGVLAADTWIHDDGWVQAWVPLTATPDETDNRSWRGFSAVGLLAADASLPAARQELAGLRAALAAEYPEENTGWGLRVEPMREHVAGPVRSTLSIFSIAVACVLLIGCANVANLLLVRAIQRGPELAVRASLGAGPWRLLRQVLAESVLLAAIGGGAGLLLAVLATDAFLALVPPDVPRLEEVGIDLRVVAFTILLSLATALLFGLPPALRAARAGLGGGLRSGRHGGGAGARRVRNALVVAQMAMALVLLVIAALLARSFAGLLAWNPGFDRQGLVIVSAFANYGQFENGRRIVDSFERIADGVRAVPGVLAVGQTSAGPLFGGRETSTMQVEGAPPLPPEELPVVRWYDVDGAYFAAMGIPMVRGRTFADADDLGAPPVAIVNQTLARRHFRDGEAVGGAVTVDERRMEIVGVVADVAPLFRGEAPAAEIYYPKRQVPRGATFFVVRSAIPPASLERQVLERAERDHPQVALSGFGSLDERASRQLVSPRFSLALMGLFALVALVLAAVGVYGVTAYGVATRTRELGLRVALGAAPGALARSIVASVLALAGIGLALGVGMALAAGRLLASQLHGVSSSDLPTYVVVAGVVLAVAGVASSLAARRAARLDLVQALRVQ